MQCPLLVLAGDGDKITPSSVVKKVAEKYGEQATFQELSGHGHWLVEEEGWEDVAAGVLDWLEKQG